MTLFEEVCLEGIPYDCHESDLYIPCTDKTRALVRKYGIKATTFISQIDKKAWFDCPFMYSPWWEARQKAS